MKTANEHMPAVIPTRALWLLRILLLFNLSATVIAETYLDFDYSYFGASVYITRYNGPGGAVTIPGDIYGLPVVSVGGWAFAGCTNVTSIRMPNSVNYIAVFAFAGCTRLRGLTIPDGVTSLGNFAFDHCASLTRVTIPNRVTNIGQQVFSYCTNLTGITIPGSVATIGNQAFSHCARLTNVTISEGVASIGISTFAGCDRLTSINIPHSVTNIGNWAFADCASLTSIRVVTPNPAYSSLAGVLFNKSRDAVVAYPGGKAGGYTLPGSVTSVGDYAFSNCAGLTSVTIHSGVTNFGFNAFSGCSNLVSVYFEGDAPSVEGKALFNNANHVTVYFRAGTRGWGATFAGRPTRIWAPPPAYSEWTRSVGLLDQYPNASGGNDDPDQDGANNLAEMYAGTDPTQANSVLRLEPSPRTNDLSEADQIPLGAEQHALYFQSVPGKTYLIQSIGNLSGGPWQYEATVTATTTQKRIVLTQPGARRFYRVMLQP